MAFRGQVALPLTCKSIHVPTGYRLDLVVEDRLVLEIKSVERVLPVREAQFLAQLRMSGLRTGLLPNFNHIVLKHSVRRVVA